MPFQTRPTRGFLLKVALTLLGAHAAFTRAAGFSFTILAVALDDPICRQCPREAIRQARLRRGSTTELPPIPPKCRPGSPNSKDR